MTRESLLDLLWSMLGTMHEDAVSMRTPQGIVILQGSGRHLLVQVSNATLEPTS